ncbi:MAG: AsmA family protein [Pseudomonadota bacterium]
MKWLLRILGALALALVAAALGLWLFLPAERIARIAADRAQTALGRPVAIEGGVSVRLLPHPGDTLRGVSVGNAPDGEAEHLLTAEAVHLGVALAPLLSGRVEVARLDIDGPMLALEISPQGAPNWAFAPPTAAAPGTPVRPAPPSSPPSSAQSSPPSSAPSSTSSETLDAPTAPEPPATERSARPPAAARTPAAAEPSPAQRLPEIGLPRAVLADAVVTFHDRRTGRRERIEALDLALEAPALDSPVSVEADGVWGDAPLSLRLTAGSPAALLSRDPVDADLSATLGGLTLDWTGRLRLPADPRDPRALPEAEGRLALAAPAPQAALERLGLALPPELGALAELAFAADIAATPAGLSVSATLDAQRNGAPLTGALTLEGAPDWRRARAARIDLALAQTGLAEARWSGRVGLSPAGAPRLDGTLSAGARRPAQLLEKLGLAPPPLAAQLRDARIDARLDLSPDGLALDLDAAAARDGTDAPLSGALSLRGGPGWADDRRFELTAQGRAAGLAAAAFDGRLAAPPGDRPSASGRLSAESTDLRALLRLLGARPPKGLRPRALRTASLDAALSATGRSLSLREATYRLDGMEATGPLDLDLYARPKIEGRLQTGPLDLRPYLAARRSADAGAEAPARPQPEGWSQAPLHLTGLQAADARLLVSAPSVTLPDLALGAVDARATLENGALALRLRRAEAFGGVLKGRLTADGAAPRPALSARLTGEALRLRPLLAALAGTDRIEGLGAFQLDLGGAGANLHEIMQNLAGDASVQLTDGAILGVNLAAMARNAAAAFLDAAAGEARKTDFASISASFSGREGRFRNDDLRFLGPLLRISGAGVVDLGGRRLDYDLAPRAVASLKGQGDRRDRRGLLLPLTVEGPWSAPAVSLDLAAAAAAGLTPESVADGLSEGLGDAVRGLSVDDPAKALEDAAGGALRRLAPGLAPTAPDAAAPAAAPAKDSAAEETAGKETAVERRARRQAERKAQRQADRQADRKAERAAERKQRRAQDAPQAPQGADAEATPSR